MVKKKWAVRCKHKRPPNTFGFNYFETREDAENFLKKYDVDYRKRCKIINDKSKLWIR